MSIAEVEEHEDREERERLERAEAEMKAQGVQTEEHAQQSYFGFDERYKAFMPDGISYIEHQPLNEGTRRKYMNEVQKELRLQRTTGDAIMKMQTGEERYQLLLQAVVGWGFIGPDGTPVPFSGHSPGSEFGKWLDKADPKLVDIVHKDVVKHNPWLMADLTVEEIDKQMSELAELRETKLREEEGKDS